MPTQDMHGQLLKLPNNYLLKSGGKQIINIEYKSAGLLLPKLPIGSLNWQHGFPMKMARIDMRQ